MKFIQILFKRVGLQFVRGDASKEESHERTRLEQQLAQARKQLNTLTKSLEHERARFAHMRDGLIAKIATVREGLAEVRSARDQLKQDYRTLAAERDDLAQASRQLGKQLEAERIAHEALVRQWRDARSIGSPTAPLDSAGARPASKALGYFRLGEHFQSQGAMPFAVDAYQSVGPKLRQLLTQKDPFKQRIAGPDFLIIGAPRAGTTWLRKQLAFHPEIFVLEREQQYFSMTPFKPPRDYIAQFASERARYLKGGRKLYHKVRAASHRFYGEKSPTYLAMPEWNIALCATLFPDVRIICVVREPVARAWSHIKNLGLAGHADNLEHLRSVRPWNTLDEIVLAGRYEQHLRAWARRLDPSQICLVDFDRIATEPNAVYREVVEHIGAAKDDPMTDHPLRDKVGGTEAGGPPVQLLDYLNAAYQDDLFDLASLRRAMAEAAAEKDRGD